mmetsp:Transcript_4643/g.13663  ORF Transcript_4643/g.13663 Transcript_4643/m.13663 type:complete len:279 (+) Transcript_4643:496-1332(+)
MTSRTSETSSNCISSRTFCGSSRRSFSLACGSSTVRTPARCAATTFSLMPPTGRTSPRRVISPVIATSLRTRRPVRRDVSAVVIVTPAEGPSFGVAPSGKWMCRSVVLRRASEAVLARPSSATFARIHVSAALTLSCITSLMLPVICTAPLPATCSTSTKSVSPPNTVAASPSAMPGFVMRRATSRRGSKRGGPSTRSMSATLSAIGAAAAVAASAAAAASLPPPPSDGAPSSAPPAAAAAAAAASLAASPASETFAAIARQRAPSLRSSSRTPASRV